MTLKAYEKTLHAVFNESCTLSAYGRGVVAVMATDMYYKHTDKCKITIAGIAASLNVSPRTIKRAIAHLRRAGVVSVSKDGTANAYKLNVRWRV